MSGFIIYMLKSSIILGLMYGLYFILFRRETFFNLNRIFILSALGISLVLPLLNIQLKSKIPVSENKFEYVHHAILDVSETIEYVELTAENNVNSNAVFPFLLLAGMLVAGSRVGIQLFSIYKNIRKYDIRLEGAFKYVLIDQHFSTHSFFNYIFIHKSEFKKKRMRDVLMHEQMHARYYHSIDLLFIGFLSILQWFNPFIYLFKRALVETHEFQADQAVVDHGIDKSNYQRLVLERARSVMMTGLASNFNQSIIKSRLKMMNKIKSRNKAIVKYLLVFPIVFFVGIIFGVSQEKIERSIAEVINVTSSGESVSDGSGLVILDLPTQDNRISFYADNFHDAPEVARMEGNVKIETIDKKLRIKADNILINKEKRKLYAYSNNYVPSISPIDKSELKRTASGFGMRMHPILKVRKMHNGTDFAAAKGTNVMATANGIVREAQTDKNFGNYIIIDHGNGFSTGYMHLEDFIVKPGQSVKQGEIIGHVGNTGVSSAPHLHYEIMKDGEYVDPADYLGKPTE